MSDRISCIVVDYKRIDQTIEAIETFLACSQGVDVEVVVVENSDDETAFYTLRDHFALQSNVMVVSPGVNLGFGGGNNYGAKFVSGSKMLLLNNDTISVQPGYVSAMAAYMESHPGTGIAGIRQLDKELRPQICCGAQPTALTLLVESFFLHRIKPFRRFSLGQSVDPTTPAHATGYVSGACLMIERSLWERLNGFDECFFMYFEETDLCLRASRAGSGVVVLPNLHLIHLGSATLGSFSDQKVRYFAQSWVYFGNKHRLPLFRLGIWLYHWTRFIASFLGSLLVPEMKAKAGHWRRSLAILHEVLSAQA